MFKIVLEEIFSFNLEMLIFGDNKKKVGKLTS